MRGKRKRNTVSLFLLTLTLLLLFPTKAAAASLMGGVSIPLNDGWTEQEPELENVVFYAYAAERGMTVSVYELRNLGTNLVHDLNELTEEELGEQIQSIETSENDNVAFGDHRILRTEHLLFLVFEGEILFAGEDDESDFQKTGSHFVEYTTIVNGGSLSVLFYHDKSSLSEEESDYLDDIIRGIQVDEICEKGVDRGILLKIVGVGFVAILLILSAAWHVRSYRKRNRIK